MTFVITIADVLQQQSGAPNPLGINVYDAFASIGRVTLLGGPEPDKDEYFLATQGLTRHAMYQPLIETVSTDLVEQRLYQIARLRATGVPVTLFVDGSPALIAAAHEKGIPTLLYLHPRFSSPEHRPDYKAVAKPWDEMVGAVDRQIELAAGRKVPVQEISEEDDQ